MENDMEPTWLYRRKLICPTQFKGNEFLARDYTKLQEGAQCPQLRVPW